MKTIHKNGLRWTQSHENIYFCAEFDRFATFDNNEEIVDFGLLSDVTDSITQQEMLKTEQVLSDVLASAGLGNF